MLRYHSIQKLKPIGLDPITCDIYPIQYLNHFTHTCILNMQVLRDGQWQEQDAAILVPGDVISIKLGDIIPADARLLEGDPLKIDQASCS